MRKHLYLLFAAIAAAGAAKAQISITALPYSLSEGFNSYNPSSATNLTSTIPTGWTASSPSPTYNGKTTGGATQGGYYGLGSNSTTSALAALRSGQFGSGSSKDVTYAVSFTNNTATTITTITLSWDYKQSTYNNLSGWDVSGTGGLANIPTLDSKDYVGVNSGTGIRTVNTNYFTLTGLSIAPGATFGIKWETTDATGSDNLIAIDNFTLRASDCTPGTWTGTTSTDWNDASNWCSYSVPTATTNVTIPSGVTNMPVVSTTSASVNKLTLEAGASVDVAASSGLTAADTVQIISGATLSGAGAYTFNSVISNSGSFTPTGNITFSGVDTQSIPGITNAANITINNSKAVVLNGAVTTQTLSLGNGLLITNGSALEIASPNAQSITGANANSYIVGKVRRSNMQNSGVYNFPVGANGLYLPVQLSLPTAPGAITPDVFTVEAVSGPNATPNPNNLVSPLARVDVSTYWNIDRINGTNPVDITLPYSASRGVTDPTTLVIAHYDGSQWNGLNPVTPPASGATDGTITATGVTSFSPFTIGATTVQPLPVQLVRFNISQTATAAILRWELAQVAAGEKVSLERSANGSEYVTLMNSNEAGVQSYTDNQPLNGTGFYRLKLQHNDGRVVYSNVLKAVFGNKVAVAVYPNPVTNVLHIEVPAVTGAGSIAIYNLSGQRVHSQSVNAAGTYTVDMQRLPAGLYQVNVISAAGAGTFRVQNLK